jgi:hypothetical protein
MTYAALQDREHESGTALSRSVSFSMAYRAAPGGGSSAMVGTPYILVGIYLDGGRLGETEGSKAFRDLAETPGFEIRAKRENSALMHLKSYEIDSHLTLGVEVPVGGGSLCMGHGFWRLS